jgi:hypothetical protein
VTITGTGFANTNTVLFGNYSAGAGVSTNGTSLTFTVPSNISPACSPSGACPEFLMVVSPGVYQVSVETAGGTSNALPFTVVAPTTTASTTL